MPFLRQDESAASASLPAAQGRTGVRTRQRDDGMQLALDGISKKVGAQPGCTTSSLALRPGARQRAAGRHAGGQDHPAAHHGRAGPAERGPRAGRRRGRHRRAGAPAQRGHGLPAVHQLPVADGVREHRLAAAAARRARTSTRRVRATGRARCTSTRSWSAIRPSCPAASSSARRWRARWPRTRR